MIFDLANSVGLLGSAIMVAAYAYSNMAKEMNFIWFNMANLIGSILLMASLTVHFNMASMALEVVWAIIALLGLAKAFRKKLAA
jgi:hypothetical protein